MTGRRIDVANYAYRYRLHIHRFARETYPEAAGRTESMPVKRCFIPLVNPSGEKYFLVELKKLYGPDTIILFAEDHTRRNSIGLGSSVKFDRNGEYEYPEEARNGYHGDNNNFLMLDGAVEFERYKNTVNPFFNKWITRFVYR